MNREKERQLGFVTALSIGVALTLVLTKAAAWLMTGSVALLGSLMDSFLDLMISTVNFFTVRHALTPADREHRFGHGKAEAMAALGQGAVIGLSAVFLARESFIHFLDPRPLTHGNMGIAVLVFSIFLTLLLVAVQKRTAKKTGSIAVLADSMHYQSDVLMNLAVIGALVLSTHGGIRLADPVLGFAVALILLRSAWRILAEAVDQLMDRELPDADRNAIKRIIRSHPEVRALHDLRTRMSGTRKFIQCHIELDGSLSLFAAHKISDDVEMLIVNAYPEAEVIIHQDPAGYEEVSNLERS